MADRPGLHTYLVCIGGGCRVLILMRQEEDVCKELLMPDPLTTGLCYGWMHFLCRHTCWCLGHPG